MGRKHGQRRSAAKEVTASPATETGIRNLMIAACAQIWDASYAEFYGQRIFEAGPWTAQTLREITADNAADKTGMENMRRYQVVQVAHRVADQIEIDESRAGAVGSRGSAAAVNGSRSEGNPDVPGDTAVPAAAKMQHRNGEQGRRAGNTSSQRGVSAGLASVVTERQLGENAVPHQANTAAHSGVLENVSGEVETAAPAEQSSAHLAASVVTQFIGMLSRHSYHPLALQKVTTGYEQQWNKSVGVALLELQQEFKIEDVVAKYSGLCDMSKELFLRELRGKATRILAYKKRRSKGKQA